LLAFYPPQDNSTTLVRNDGGGSYLDGSVSGTIGGDGGVER